MSLMLIEKIKKRNGTVVEFDRVRIERAMGKAFAATNTPVPDGTLVSITDQIIAELEDRFTDEKIPGVEDIQDIVERKLGEAGYFEVAKSYILYRKDREKAREAERQAILDRVERRDLMVRKRNGSLVRFDIAEVERAVNNAARMFPSAQLDVAGIVADCKVAMYDGISTSEINRGTILAARSRIERDSAYSYLAARLLLNDLYKDVIKINEFEGGFSKIYKDSFREVVQNGVLANRLDPRLLDFDFQKLSPVIEPARDQLFEYLGAQTLYDRYFLKDHSQKILELPQHFWMRVSMGLSLLEKNKEESAIRFYNTISRLLYVPSTPTLFHSGTTHPQMSSCYLTTVEDDLSHIFKAIADNAQLSKWSGGLGNDWSNIRATGALIKSTNVGSQGVVPFLKIVDSTTAAINRSGKRRGATCVYLETWHYDIEDFLELRKNTGDDRRRTHDTNTANWIPDLFIKRVMEDGDWTLFSPHEVPELHHTYGRDFETRYVAYERKAERGEIKLWKRVKAQSLWRKMITMMFETGHPWITFKDPCNIRSPQDHVGVVHSSNLCTEITLNTSKDETAVCNLGSINVVRHIVGGKLDKNLLQETAKTAIRMLDSVVDINFYPTVEAQNANLKHRPVGMGIMGLQDAFYELGLDFDSDRAVDFSDELMEYISYYVIMGSSEIAKEKGAYVSYKGSKWDRGLLPIDTLKVLEDERGVPVEVSRHLKMNWTPVREHIKQYGMRNSNTMAIAPTATIANIAGCLPSIEPIYKNLYVKANVSGDFTVVNGALVNELKKLGLWTEAMLEKLKYYDGSLQHISEIPEGLRRKYKEAFEVAPLWVVKHAAARGKWIDQSQSINIFTSSDSGKELSDIYLAAWKAGLKTTYYLRTLSASGVEKSTIDINKKFDGAAASAAPAPRPKVKIVGEVCESCQ